MYYNLPHVFYYNLRQSYYILPHQRLLHFTAFLLQFTAVLHFTAILLQFTALITIYRVYYNLRRNTPCVENDVNRCYVYNYQL